MLPEAVGALLCGFLIGSFLNVCIYRMPRDLSIVRPRSYCPICDHPIAWYDNVPVLSYFILRGRCRYCGSAISWRYPVVEVLSGALFFFIVFEAGVTLAALKACALVAMLVALAFADLESRILPDEFTLGGLVLGLILAWFIPVEDFVARAFLSLYNLVLSPRWASVVEAALGAVLPAGFLWLSGFLFEKIRRKEGLGLGDVKMVAMMGAFLGLRGCLLALVAGSLLGSVVGLAYIFLTRKDASSYELPFGTFLAVAGIGAALYLLA